ncbi:MAG: hypothetical protein EOL87_15735 [Spartobacteria bacterium]|nr:hypothetical protein [Spartobacteria bacterium]
MSFNKRVFVTGAGLTTSIGTSLEETWRHLLDGKTGVREARRFDGSRYDGAPVCPAELKGHTHY